MKLIARALIVVAITLFFVLASKGITADYAQAAAAAPGQPVAPSPLSAPATPGVVPPRPTTPAGQQAKPEEQLRIVADPATNSLIIYGTVQEFQNIKTILKELDQVPRQVLLDVLVAEVTLTDNQKLGVDYEVLSRNPSSIFGQKFPSAGAVRTLADLFPTTGAFGGGISGVFGGKDIKAFVNALQSDTRFKVLSSPSILATDNKPARIQVGTEEPIATGTTTTQVGTAASSTSIQYRNTGRIVTIIPQVNSQGLVNLQILAEVSQKRDKNVTVGADTFPAFDTRQAETTAVVQDGDSLVFGGIITDNKNRTRSGIPYLMDLPVVGRFFETTIDDAERTELIMVITPHVIRNREDSRTVTEEFRNKLSPLRNELEKMTRDKEREAQRLKDQVQEQLKAITPVPAAETPSSKSSTPTPTPTDPAPAPSAGPAAPHASTAPPREIIFGPNGSPIAADTEALPLPSTESTGSLLATYEAVAPQPKAVNTREGRKGQPVVKPAVLARAVTGKGESHPAEIPDKTGGSQPRPVWMVQVAAFTEKKDAEALATNLRALGYEAFTQLGEVDAKIWHRVRVGKIPNRKDAVELQKTLKANNKFEQAFLVNQ
jgi:Flp pilus assembly secretin CpaC